ncbi:MAG: ABC transporter permease [Ilumatobacteraceae bacterium]
MNRLVTLRHRVSDERSVNQLRLAVRLAQRQVAQKYRESLFGGLWALLNPLLLLGIYWFVFSEVFDSRWTGPGEDRHYALLIFSGLIFFTLYAEIVNGSTFLVQSNAMLIKRTTVSARVIPLASSLASTFTFALNLIPFLLMFVILERSAPPASLLVLPFVVLPLLVMSTGIAFILASVSAYFRDLQQVVPLINTAILFVSPIFFPSGRLPGPIDTAVRYLTPLVIPLDASKRVMFLNEWPEPGPMITYTIIAVIVCAFGWAVYGRASRGFADVV